MGHACYAEASRNPYWRYRAISVDSQKAVCMNGSAYQACPMYQRASGCGLAAPEAAAMVGAAKRWWWPF